MCADQRSIDVGLGARKTFDTRTVDPIQLSIFSHRFMGIAEQMGRALQKTCELPFIECKSTADRD